MYHIKIVKKVEQKEGGCQKLICIVYADEPAKTIQDTWQKSLQEIMHRKQSLSHATSS